MNPMSDTYANSLTDAADTDAGEDGDNVVSINDTQNGDAAAIEEPQGPVGPDFTKPLRTVVGRTPVRILTVSAANADFPVIALVKRGDAEVPVSYNLMGEDPDLERVIENIPPIPPVAIGRVLRSTTDDSLCFDSKVFSNETEARDAAVEGFEFISTYRVLLPQVNDRGEQEEIEEADDTGPQEMRVNGRILKVGQEITVNRRGFGFRQASILKFRDVPGKQHMQVFVKPVGSADPYWARNSSIR